MFQETVTLVLKHSDISTTTTSVSASSSAGSWTNGKQSTTWYINMRNLLGNEMYDNNDMFVLRLNQIAYASANYPLSATNDTVLEIQLSGLNFVNSTYDVRTGNSSNKYRCALLHLPASTGGVINFAPNVSLCNFKKSDQNIYLTIDLIRTIDNQPAEYGTEKFPHCGYSFDIYPIKHIK